MYAAWQRHISSIIVISMWQEYLIFIFHNKARRYNNKKVELNFVKMV